MKKHRVGGPTVYNLVRCDSSTDSAAEPDTRRESLL